MSALQLWLYPVIDILNISQTIADDTNLIPPHHDEYNWPSDFLTPFSDEISSVLRDTDITHAGRPNTFLCEYIGVKKR